MPVQSGFFGKMPSGATLLSSGWELLPVSSAGFTQLYRSRQKGRSRLFKCLKPEFRGQQLYEELLRKEFDIGYSLAHPCICEYYSFLDVPEVGFCIELEWIEGRTLEQRIQDGMSVQTGRKLLLELCDALDYMHRRQVFHRDLKPSNVMITDKGDNVRIIDFGLSDADGILFGKEPAGTLSYAAPELLSGGEADARSDIYSLGLLMRRMPGPWGAVARKCTHTAPEDRFQTAAEVKLALLKRPSARWPLLAVLLLIVLGGVLFWWQRKAGPPEAEEPASVDGIFEQTQQLILDAGFPEELPQE